jgi:hypothetical protein
MSTSQHDDRHLAFTKSFNTPQLMYKTIFKGACIRQGVLVVLQCLGLGLIGNLIGAI